MDRKPPRPKTLTIPTPMPSSGKKQIKVSRQRKTASWLARNENKADLKYLANDIKSIIQGISFENTDDVGNSRDRYLRKSYIGVTRSASIEDTRKLARRSDIVSSFYREKEGRDHLTRESMHIARRAALQDAYNEERGDIHKGALKRVSCPWDMYFDMDSRSENRSLTMLAQELQHVRQVREKEVRDLLSLNSKLQDELFQSDQDIVTLQETNVNLEKRLDDMLQVYERIKDNLKRCLSKVKDLEKLEKCPSQYNSDDEPILNRKGDNAEVSSISSGFKSDVSDNNVSNLGYDGESEGSICADIGRQLDDAINGTSPILGRSVNESKLKRSDRPSHSAGGTPRAATPNSDIGPSPAEKSFLGRLQADVDSLSLVNSEQSQEIERLRADLSSCRKHMMTSQFQLEAVEIECSRLLSMEDSLISVITLLKRAKEQHIHRQLLGDLVLGAVTIALSMEDDASPGLCVDTFLRELQEQLSLHPVLTRGEITTSSLEGATASVASVSSSNRVNRDNRTLLENLKFIDDEEITQLSDNDSFHSLGKHLNDDKPQGSPDST